MKETTASFSPVGEKVADGRMRGLSPISKQPLTCPFGRRSPPSDGERNSSPAWPFVPLINGCTPRRADSGLSAPSLKNPEFCTAANAQEKRQPSDVDGCQHENGEGGIRTPGPVARTQHFQCCTIGHSATSPDVCLFSAPVDCDHRRNCSRCVVPALRDDKCMKSHAQQRTIPRIPSAVPPEWPVVQENLTENR